MARGRRSAGRPTQKAARSARLREQLAAEIATTSTAADRAAVTCDYARAVLARHSTPAAERHVDDLTRQLRDFCTSLLPTPAAAHPARSSTHHPRSTHHEHNADQTRTAAR